MKKKITYQPGTYSTAIFSRNVKKIMGLIRAGYNINTDCGVRVFDTLLSVGNRNAEREIDAVLGNPSWNPNYRSADLWHPEERAMLHHREDLAIRVIQHPNFDQKELPRVIRSAHFFGAGKVLDYLAKRERS